MQTLRMSEESERQLFDTLKHIYGSVCTIHNSFKCISKYFSVKQIMGK